jgi:hypothetical protein
MSQNGHAALKVVLDRLFAIATIGFLRVALVL